MYLPTLMAFRALEAAARHRSYSRAAAELNVTHGAISQQIRRLEEQLGIPLFRRLGNGMEPFPAALKLAATIAEALQLLNRAVEETGGAEANQPLVISVEQGFARRWLTPRLMRLRNETAEHDLDLRLENRLADFVGDGIDAAIRFGDYLRPGCETASLFKVQLFPVCSPQFLEDHRLEQLNDLYSVPLLHHANALWSWPALFRSLGLPAPQGRGMTFDDTSFMLEAAAQGAGVALARSSLVRADLKAERLVRPLSAEIESSWGYCFVWPTDSPKLSRILVLRDWLLKVAATESQES